MAHEAGKGSKARPFSVTQEEYDNRWDAIFGRDAKTKTEEKNQTEQKTTDNQREK